MANRQLAQREVTDVAIPNDRTGEMLATGAQVADAGIELMKKRDLAKMNNFAADGDLQMMRATNEWRIANQSNPDNPEAISKLNTTYDKIMGQYNEKVSLLSRGQWVQAATKMKQKYQMSNLEWGQKQIVTNTENDLNSAIKTNLFMASERGKTGDIQMLKTSFQDARNKLAVSAYGLIGKERTEELLSDFESDYAKMFMAGMIETDAKSAGVMLEREDVKTAINNPEHVETLKRMIDKKEVEERKFIVEKHDQLKANLQDAFLNDQLTEIDIIKAEAIPQEQGGLKATEAVMLKKALYAAQDRKFKEIIKDNKSAKNYATLVEKFSDNAVDARQAKEMIVEAYKDGFLDKAEAIKLNKLKSILEDVQWNKNTGFFVNIVKGIKSFFGDKPENHTEQAKALSSFVNMVSDGKKAEDALADVQLSVAANNYPWLVGKKPGDIIENRFGKKRKFYGLSQSGAPIMEDIK